MNHGELTVIEAPPAPPAPLHIIACPHPFKAAHEEHSLMPGKSLLEILREVQPDIHCYGAHVWVGETYIPEPLWSATYPAPGSEITIRVVPQGSVGRVIGQIFIAIAAIAAAVILQQYYAVPMIFSAMAGMAVSIVGNMVMNALIPPTSNPHRQAALQGNNLQNGSSSSPTYSLTGGSNVINKYGPVPKILGRNLVAPNFGARTYTEVVGGIQYLRL